ncbi:hypothetical protein [Myxococcus landrumensis]|uniref:Uncharacterized protein n=1 Tax=Myxococcus landrumensis TaxID=2813577 RepID=A0ABX7NGJ9_9BACT|nr:hypothetical protein [Myxococcus landrumus]QSQ17533.1 hypothetical protein JY572_16470 [Myxococcus landrumus]
MTVIARLLMRQALCGLVGWGLFLLFAKVSCSARHSRFDGLTLLELAAVPPLGFALTTLVCAPLLIRTWRRWYWWMGTVAAAIISMMGAGSLYLMATELRTFGTIRPIVGPAELAIMATLGLPIAALAVIVQGRSRLTKAPSER